MQTPPLIIIPARNEQKTVAIVVRQVIATYGYPVLVVNDDSADGTADEARRAGAMVLSMPFNLGAWGAMQTGILYALDNGYSCCVTMDADGQHPVAGLRDLLEPVQSGRVDAAIGSCVQRGSPMRKFAWRFFRRLTGIQVKDMTSGFRAYSRAALEMLADEKAAILDYQDIGVLFVLKRAGLTIAEVQVNMACRVYGHSRIFNTWFAVGEYMLLSSILALSKNMYSRRRKGVRA